MKIFLAFFAFVLIQSISCADVATSITNVAKALKTNRPEIIKTTDDRIHMQALEQEWIENAEKYAKLLTDGKATSEDRAKIAQEAELLAKSIEETEKEELALIDNIGISIVSCLKNDIAIPLKASIK